MKKKLVTFVINEEVLNEFRTKCEKEEKAMSLVIRELIKLYIKEDKK